MSTWTDPRAARHQLRAARQAERSAARDTYLTGLHGTHVHVWHTRPEDALLVCRCGQYAARRFGQ